MNVYDILRFKDIVLFNTAAFPPPYIPWRLRALRFPPFGKLAIQGVSSGDPQGSIHTVTASVHHSGVDFTANAAPDGTVTLMFSIFFKFIGN